jgi:hypothetical protein
MSGPAHAVRLHIHVCDGLSGMSRILDRLSLVGLTPMSIVFRRGQQGQGFLHLTLAPKDSTQAETLAVRLEQVIPVIRVRLSPSAITLAKNSSS